MAGTISTTITASYTLSVETTTILSTGAVLVGAVNGYAIVGQGGTAWTVFNAGSIEPGGTSASAGIVLDAGGYVSNAATGTITSDYCGIYMPTGNGTVVNDRGITAVRSDVYVKTGTGILINTGSIAAIGTTGAAIAFVQGGYVSNAASGVISSAQRTGVYIAHAAGTVVNAGQINGGGGKAGVNLSGGGSLINQVNGTITGGATGHSEVYMTGAAGTVTNFGLLTGGSGVALFAGGTVINDGTIGGTVAGAGVFITGASGGVVNAGLMGNVGLASGGAVTNQASGTIAGAAAGVNVNGAGTVISAGTIEGGNGVAIVFGGSYADRVVVDPGAVFIGTVNGGTAASTLELASGASAGTLTGLGTQFIKFAQVTVDAGANWTLAGSDTNASGATLTNSGSLAVASYLLNAGSIAG